MLPWVSHVLAVEKAEPGSFAALVEAFASFATVIGLHSACLAFFSWMNNGTPQQIQNAAALGPALGFVPGLAVSLGIYLDGVLNA